MKLNVKHINKILDHIRGDLNRLWMPWFGVQEGTPAGLYEEIDKFADCGTACCFAGWSLLLSMPKSKWSKQFSRKGDLDIDSQKEAERLGLTEKESSNLFAAAFGSRKQQFEQVKKRLRSIIAHRVAVGETSARKIRV